MAKSLSEYIEWLDNRPQLLWPKPPLPAPLEATPYLKPLPEMRAVCWCIYGTLLNIQGGRLYHVHPQDVRMQIALQKTIDEFAMWHSMTRKPGQPWESMLPQYAAVVEELRMAATKRKGDASEVDSSKVWFKIIDRLLRNEYPYDADLYGTPEELALKVAYFFHAMLQGVGMPPATITTLRRLNQAGLRQGLLDDAQPFTLKQLQYAIQKVDPSVSLGSLVSPDCVALSFQFGMKKPSETLFAIAAAQYRRLGIDPQQVLYVSHRLADDLAVAKRHSFRTALYAGDAGACQVDAADLRDPALKPDRLITDVTQIVEILGV